MIDVIGPTVQKNHWRVIGRTCFGVCNIQDAGIYLLERGERSIRSRPDRKQLCLSCLAHPPTRSCRAEWPRSQQQRRRNNGDASLSVLRFWECSWRIPLVHGYTLLSASRRWRCSILLLHRRRELQWPRGEDPGTPCRGHARFNASGTGGRCGPSPSRPHGTRVRNLKGWDRP